MYTMNEVQDMISTLLNNGDLMKVFCKNLENTNASDRMAIMSVLREGWYEEFDRYDSDVCEQFITLYEKAVG